MANKNFDNEQLSDEQLNAVVGGTMTEFNQILSTVYANTHLQNEFKEQLAVVTGGNLGGNLDLEKMTGTLKNILSEVGIEAKISVLGTNTYTDKINKNTLSHNEVIARIKNYR